jgi:hypothetical protein
LTSVRKQQVDDYNVYGESYDYNEGRSEDFTLNSNEKVLPISADWITAVEIVGECDCVSEDADEDKERRNGRYPMSSKINMEKERPSTLFAWRILDICGTFNIKDAAMIP